jgi:hypothetical protein
MASGFQEKKSLPSSFFFQHFFNILEETFETKHLDGTFSGTSTLLQHYSNITSPFCQQPSNNLQQTWALLQHSFNIPSTYFNTSLALLEHHLFNTPPTYFNTPPTYFNTPPTYFNTPPTYFNTPPTYLNTPSTYFNTPPTYFNTSSTYLNTSCTMLEHLPNIISIPLHHFNTYSTFLQHHFLTTSTTLR